VVTLIATFIHQRLVKVPLPSNGYLLYLHSWSKPDISHGRIKAAIDANLLEVVGSSETAHTLTACDHLDSIRTTIPRLFSVQLLEFHTGAAPGFHTNNYQR